MLWKPLRVILIVEEDVVTWVMISSQQELKLKMLVREKEREMNEFQIVLLEVRN